MTESKNNYRPLATPAQELYVGGTWKTRVGELSLSTKDHLNVNVITLAVPITELASKGNNRGDTSLW